MRPIIWAIICIVGICGAIAGAVTLFNSGVIADATGTPGSSPWGWISLIAGAVMAFLGFVKLMQALSKARGRG